MRVYFDSCAFIEAFERESRVSAILLECLDWPRRPSPVVVTSELALPELLVWPLRMKQERLASFYWDLLRTTEKLVVVPVARTMLSLAARIQAEGYCSKLPDAIHVATAVSSGCDGFVTNDNRIRLPGKIQRVPLLEECLLPLLATRQ